MTDMSSGKPALSSWPFMRKIGREREENGAKREGKMTYKNGREEKIYMY